VPLFCSSCAFEEALGFPLLSAPMDDNLFEIVKLSLSVVGVDLAYFHYRNLSVSNREMELKDSNF